MNIEPTERLRTVRRCALATPVNLPFFGHRSQIAWRRSAVASISLSGPADPDLLIAACLATLSPYCDSGVHSADLRIGYSVEKDGQRHVVPVVVASPGQ